MSGANGATRHQPQIVTLGEPIRAHGQAVSQLTLRPMTGKDIRVCGVPYRVGNNGEEGIVDARAVSMMISELAGIPMSSVDQLGAVDWFNCWGAIQLFLEQTNAADSMTAAPSSPDTSMPAHGGAT
jgi:hypothetical protein